MKIHALTLLLTLGIVSCATSPPRESHTNFTAGSFHQSARLTTGSLRAFHQRLLRASAQVPWLADYRPECYAAKPLALLYGTDTSPVCIRLQLFTHGSAPFTPDSYGVFITDTGGQYDLAGTLKGERAKVDLVVGMLATTLRQASP